MPDTPPIITKAATETEAGVVSKDGDPVQYSRYEFVIDKQKYETARDAGDATLAKMKRDDMVNGLVADIDVLYRRNLQRIFGAKTFITIAGDVLTLGTTTTGAIATNAATKTIFAALGTGFTGLNLSLDKNIYSQQSFQVIAVAMDTVRKKEIKKIRANLEKDDKTYSFELARGDLQKLITSGTLQEGLGELSKEASDAAKEADKAAIGEKPDAPTGLIAQGGLDENALVWAPVSNAKTYNIYRSDQATVSTSSTKLESVTDPYYVDLTASHVAPFYYSVSAVNSAGESALSATQSANSLTISAALVANAVPTNLNLAVVSGSVVLTWTAPPGAVSFNVFRGKTAADLSAATALNAGGALNQNLYVDKTPPSGPLLYAVTATNGGTTTLQSASKQITSPTPAK